MVKFVDLDSFRMQQENMGDLELTSLTKHHFKEEVIIDTFDIEIYSKVGDDLDRAVQFRKHPYNQVIVYDSGYTQQATAFARDIESKYGREVTLIEVNAFLAI